MVVDSACTLLYPRYKVELKDNGAAKRPLTTIESVQELQTTLATATTACTDAETAVTTARDTQSNTTGALTTAIQRYVQL